MNNLILKHFHNKCYRFQAIIFEEVSPKGEIVRKELGGN